MNGQRKAVLMAIGDELLSGVRREGNCAYLARLLHDAGWAVERIEVIPDEQPQMIAALNRWIGRVDLLVLSGGLGPTHDDRTRYAIAEYLHCGLAVNDAMYDRVVGRFEGTSLRDLIERSRPVQGLVPTEADAVYNPAGSALGIHFERQGTHVWSFPGVPFEFSAMARQELAPSLTASHCWVSVSVLGVPESLLVERIPEIIADERLHISVLPSFGLVELVIRGDEALIDRAEATVRERFAREALPRGCSTLPEAILYAGRAGKLTLSCAESCTGGLVGATLTDLPGSSDVFVGSAVVYSNAAKTKVLGVSESILERRGAVSGECAEAMAAGALDLYGTSVAVAITGIAGPDGGSEEKPVGTVWFAVASRLPRVNGCDALKVESFRRRFDGSRELVRERAVKAALNSVWLRMRETCDVISDTL